MAGSLARLRLLFVREPFRSDQSGLLQGAGEPAAYVYYILLYPTLHYPNYPILFYHILFHSIILFFQITIILF